MTCLVTHQAPDFTAQAVMPNGAFQEISLSHYRGQYVLLFFYPLDFTFVCPTEIIAFSDAAKKSLRNIPKVCYGSQEQLTPYDLLWADKLVITKAALAKIEEGLK